jgi:hypothetical protein
MVSVKPIRDTFVGVLLLVAAVSGHAWCASRGWTIAGMQGQEFRQAQTAITIDAMKHDGFRLDYSTPVLGKPWSIPMEFPLYQWLVTRLVAATGLPTVEAGRWISLMGFYLSLPALLLVLRAAGLEWSSASCALLPVLASPLYLFYSRTVLIESLAFAFSAWFLACALQYQRRDRWGWLAGAWAAGALAVLVKVTTWTAFVVPWALVVGWAWWQSEIGRAKTTWPAVRKLAVVALPILAVAEWWIRTADRIKEQNPLAHFLLSRNLTGFNFGLLGQRFSAEFWERLYFHWTHGIMPGWGLLAVLVGSFLVEKRWRLLAAAALAGFLVVQLVFANLYFIHDHYHYANGAFLALAAGLIICGLWAASGVRRWVGAALLPALLAGQAHAYWSHFYVLQTRPVLGDTGLTQAIRDLTEPGDVLVIQGADWNAMIPFYAQRRALMVPDIQAALVPEVMAQNVAALHDEHVALVLFMGRARDRQDWIEQRIKDFDLNPVPLFFHEQGVTVYAAKDVYMRDLHILLNDQCAGVTVNGKSPIVATTQIQPLGARLFASVFADMSPTPERGVLPFGLWLLHDGRRHVFMAHTPTDLYFTIPTGATTVEIVYRVSEKAYEHEGFDGVQFVVEYRPAPGEKVILMDDWMGPESPVNKRGNRTRLLPLPTSASGEVVVRTLPGPHNNGAFDWALLEKVVIH